MKVDVKGQDEGRVVIDLLWFNPDPKPQSAVFLGRRTNSSPPSMGRWPFDTDIVWATGGCTATLTTQNLHPQAMLSIDHNTEQADRNVWRGRRGGGLPTE